MAGGLCSWSSQCGCDRKKKRTKKEEQSCDDDAEEGVYESLFPYEQYRQDWWKRYQVEDVRKVDDKRV